MAEIENSVKSLSDQGKKGLGVLIDPDKYTDEKLVQTLDICHKSGVDFLFCGGSLLTDDRFEKVISLIKSNTTIPVVIFPGNGMQISRNADAILLLSLVSGRNPDLLIGQHVMAAPLLKASGLEVIPTAYLLIDGGRVSTTQYISNTQPIPADKADIAVCTALASEMLGFRIIYLEAGSGAALPVPEKMITRVKSNISLPLIVGGGIRSGEQAKKMYLAGADVIVIGNAVESDPKIILDISLIKTNFNNH
jgi:phosphoglycerol geranylgeranyltransferase